MHFSLINYNNTNRNITQKHTIKYSRIDIHLLLFRYSSGVVLVSYKR